MIGMVSCSSDKTTVCTSNALAGKLKVENWVEANGGVVTTVFLALLPLNRPTSEILHVAVTIYVGWQPTGVKTSTLKTIMLSRLVTITIA